MLNRSNQRINYYRYLLRKKFQTSESPYFFGYGRTALKVGLSSYNIPKGKMVFAPEYICGAALEPFTELGLGIKYYSVNTDLSPDWDSVKNKLSTDMFGILMVHYFGIPQNIEQFTLFAKENNLLLIEDNSHGHGGLYLKKLLGTFGDIGISSPRKSFPVLNGGVLFLNRKNKILGDDLPYEPANVPKLIARDITGRMLDYYPSAKNLFLKKIDAEREWDTKVEDWCIDAASYNILMKYNFKRVREIRSRIYQAWEMWCKSHNLTSLFSIKNGSLAPLSLPLIFNNKNERDHWLEIFRRNHIAAYLWPDLPEEIMNTENSGKDLHGRILCLPIHLSMRVKKIENLFIKKRSF